MFNLRYFANNFFSLTYWANLGGEPIIDVVTPIERTVFIGAENREVFIKKEDRSVEISK